MIDDTSQKSEGVECQFSKTAGKFGTTLNAKWRELIYANMYSLCSLWVQPGLKDDWLHILTTIFFHAQVWLEWVTAP